MTDQPIQVDFSIYNQIELLRQEIDRREDDLKDAESRIRDILFELEKIRYLQSLDTFYHDQKNLAYPDNYDTFPDLEQRRLDLIRVIGVLKQNLDYLSGQAGAPKPKPAAAAADAPQRAPGGAKRGFDDFDSFRQRRRTQ